MISPIAKVFSPLCSDGATSAASAIGAIGAIDLSGGACSLDQGSVTVFVKAGSC